MHHSKHLHFISHAIQPTAAAHDSQVQYALAVSAGLLLAAVGSSLHVAHRGQLPTLKLPLAQMVTEPHVSVRASVTNPSIHALLVLHLLSHLPVEGLSQTTCTYRESSGVLQSNALLNERMEPLISVLRILQRSRSGLAVYHLAMIGQVRNTASSALSKNISASHS